MPRSLEIICDMDGILVDLFAPWLGWYNERYQDDLSIEKLIQWDISQYVKEECGRDGIMAFFHPEKDHTVKPMLYRDIPALDGAVDGLRALHEAGHDIIICSAVSGSTASEKFLWCKKHLPFIPTKKIFLGYEKHRLTGDLLIDDGPHNVLAHRERWAKQVSIMSIAYPYNAEIYDHYDVYAHCYKNTRGAWEEIVKGVDALAQKEA